MIDSYHHVELNGVRYRLSEDAEGKHYDLSAEPLRPPNSVSVQGDTGQKFQVRPDILLWSLTDWSGGEGQIKFDSQFANRSRRLDSVDVFTAPGTLRPGPFLAVTEHDAAGGDFDKVVLLVSADDVLYAFDQTAPTYYTWDEVNEEWDGPTTITNPSSGPVALTSDGEKVFWVTSESGTATLWSMTAGATTATSLANTVLGLPLSICLQGNNVYIGADPHTSPPGRIIYEVDKTGGTPVAIDTVSIKAITCMLVPMDGKVYAVASDRYITEIREIIPSSAAGTGFGRQIALLEGFGFHSVWQHGGILYLTGQYGLVGTGAILYLQPDQSFGTLGQLRREEAPDTDFTGVGRAGTNSRLIEHYFVTAKRTTTEDSPSLWIIDSVSGGFANLTYPDEDVSDWNIIRSLAVHAEEVFFCAINGDGDEGRTLRSVVDSYAPDAVAVSPWHDFNLADEKLLSSITLSVEALPADWTVYVDYARDGSSSWTTEITYTTDGGTGTTSVVSTGSSTVEFRTLSIRIRLEYTGAGVPTTFPVVLGVDAKAQVLKKVKKWRLLLDMAESSGQGTTFHGRDKIDAVTTAGDLGSVVSFKDGYQNRQLGVWDEYAVVIDLYRFDLNRPEEGVAYVELLEVT